MKKLFVAGIAAAMFYSAPAVAAPTYNWTGCYIGASAGGMWGKAETDFAETKPNGFIGGGQFGCDYQYPSNWLLGLQGEFNWANAQDRQTVFPVLSIETLDAKVDWFASATARLGYASGPWLFYGKAGPAWVRDKLHDFGSVFISSFDYSGSATQTGWTGGAGFEYAFAPNWSTYFEYDFYDFGTKSVGLSGMAGVIPAASTETISLKQNFSVVKVGINYRFSTGP